MLSDTGSHYDASSYYSSSPEPQESFQATGPVLAKSSLNPRRQDWHRIMQPLRQDPILTAKKPLEVSVLDMAGAEFWDKEGVERHFQQIEYKKRVYIESLDKETNYKSRLELNLGDKLRHPACHVQPALTERTSKTAQDLYRQSLSTPVVTTRPSSGYGKKTPSIHPSGRPLGENIFPAKQNTQPRTKKSNSTTSVSPSGASCIRPRIGISPKKQRPEVHPPWPVTTPRRIVTPRSQADSATDSSRKSADRGSPLRETLLAAYGTSGARRA